MTKTRLYQVSVLGLLMMCPAIGKAQFNTIRKKDKTEYETIEVISTNKDTIENQRIELLDSIADNITTDGFVSPFPTPPKGAYCAVRKKHPEYNKKYRGLPGLTISNLLTEIRKNNIQHEKIVLAQAILETGWFTSSVCIRKNNLFGLTNPRTGEYYEFNHWTESVKAYYDKVQYRYKGGNYLMWLDEIGYAESGTYVDSLIKILRQYLM